MIAEPWASVEEVAKHLGVARWWNTGEAAKRTGLLGRIPLALGAHPSPRGGVVWGKLVAAACCLRKTGTA